MTLSVGSEAVKMKPNIRVIRNEIDTATENPINVLIMLIGR